VSAINLLKKGTQFISAPLLVDEDFATYSGTPLIAKARLMVSWKSITVRHSSLTKTGWNSSKFWPDKRLLQWTAPIFSLN